MADAEDRSPRCGPHISILSPSPANSLSITGDFIFFKTVFRARQRAGSRAWSSLQASGCLTATANHSLGSCCLIIANWHSFRCLESPRTRTIRFGPEGTPGTWLLLVLSSGGPSPKAQLFRHGSKSLALSTARASCARDQLVSQAAQHSSGAAIPCLVNWKKQKGGKSHPSK